MIQLKKQRQRRNSRDRQLPLMKQVQQVVDQRIKAMSELKYWNVSSNASP